MLSLGEIRKGVESVSDAVFRKILTDWVEVALPQYFVGRLLDVNKRVADRWGRVQAAAGRTLPVIDGLLATTALEHDLTLVTRKYQGLRGTRGAARQSLGSVRRISPVSLPFQGACRIRRKAPRLHLPLPYQKHSSPFAMTNLTTFPHFVNSRGSLEFRP